MTHLLNLFFEHLRIVVVFAPILFPLLTCLIYLGFEKRRKRKIRERALARLAQDVERWEKNQFRPKMFDSPRKMK